MKLYLYWKSRLLSRPKAIQRSKIVELAKKDKRLAALITSRPKIRSLLNHDQICSILTKYKAEPDFIKVLLENLERSNMSLETLSNNKIIEFSKLNKQLATQFISRKKVCSSLSDAERHDVVFQYQDDLEFIKTVFKELRQSGLLLETLTDISEHAEELFNPDSEMYKLLSPEEVVKVYVKYHDDEEISYTELYWQEVIVNAARYLEAWNCLKQAALEYPEIAIRVFESKLLLNSNYGKLDLSSIIEILVQHSSETKKGLSFYNSIKKIFGPIEQRFRVYNEFALPPEPSDPLGPEPSTSSSTSLIDSRETVQLDPVNFFIENYDVLSDPFIKNAFLLAQATPANLVKLVDLYENKLTIIADKLYALAEPNEENEIDRGLSDQVMVLLISDYRLFEHAFSGKTTKEKFDLLKRYRKKVTESAYGVLQAAGGGAYAELALEFLKAAKYFLSKIMISMLISNKYFINIMINHKNNKDFIISLLEDTQNICRIKTLFNKRESSFGFIFTLPIEAVRYIPLMMRLQYVVDERKKAGFVKQNIESLLPVDNNELSQARKKIIRLYGTLFNKRLNNLELHEIKQYVAENHGETVTENFNEVLRLAKVKLQPIKESQSIELKQQRQKGKKQKIKGKNKGKKKIKKDEDQKVYREQLFMFKKEARSFMQCKQQGSNWPYSVHIHNEFPYTGEVTKLAKKGLEPAMEILQDETLCHLMSREQINEIDVHYKIDPADKHQLGFEDNEFVTLEALEKKYENSKNAKGKEKDDVPLIEIYERMKSLLEFKQLVIVVLIVKSGIENATAILRDEEQFRLLTPQQIKQIGEYFKIDENDTFRLGFSEDNPVTLQVLKEKYSNPEKKLQKGSTYQRMSLRFLPKRNSKGKSKNDGKNKTEKSAAYQRVEKILEFKQAVARAYIERKRVVFEPLPQSSQTPSVKDSKRGVRVPPVPPKKPPPPPPISKRRIPALKQRGEPSIPSTSQTTGPSSSQEGSHTVKQPKQQFNFEPPTEPPPPLPVSVQDVATSTSGNTGAAGSQRESHVARRPQQQQKKLTKRIVGKWPPPPQEPAPLPPSAEPQSTTPSTGQDPGTSVTSSAIQPSSHG